MSFFPRVLTLVQVSLCTGLCHWILVLEILVPWTENFAGKCGLPFERFMVPARAGWKSSCVTRTSYHYNLQVTLWYLWTLDQSSDQEFFFVKVHSLFPSLNPNYLTVSNFGLPCILFCLMRVMQTSYMCWTTLCLRSTNISITTFTLHRAGTVWVCVKRCLLGHLFRAKRYNIIKEE